MEWDQLITGSPERQPNTGPAPVVPLAVTLPDGTTAEAVFDAAQSVSMLMVNEQWTQDAMQRFAVAHGVLTAVFQAMAKEGRF